MTGKSQSEEMWTDPPTWRVVLFWVFLGLAILSMVSTTCLIFLHGRRGAIRVQGLPASIRPPKVVYENLMLSLGNLYCFCAVVVMLGVDFAPWITFTSRLYRAYAIYAFVLYLKKTMGSDAINLFRLEDMGTLQDHEPCKVWKVFPCCMFWLCCLPCMKVKKMQSDDWNCAIGLVFQFIVISFVGGGFDLVYSYNGSKTGKDTVGKIVGPLLTLSMFLASYAAKVIAGIADKCRPIVQQVKDRYYNQIGYVGMSGPTEDDEEDKKTKLGTKLTWLMVHEALPSLLANLLRFCVSGDKVKADGGILTAASQKTYLKALCTIFISFILSILAWRVFPLEADRNILPEKFASIQLMAEVAPTFQLQIMQRTFGSIIDSRQGKDVLLVYDRDYQDEDEDEDEDDAL